MESKAYIKYHVLINEIKFDLLTLSLNNSDIESFTIETLNSKETILSFVVKNPASLEQACEDTKRIAEETLDILSVYYNTVIGKLSIEEDYLEVIDRNGNKNITRSARGGLRIGGSISRVTNINTVDKSLSNLIFSSLTIQNLIFYRQFRFAIQTNDLVARYMFLYSILLQVCNLNEKREDQKNVEAFIRKHDPMVTESQHPEKKTGVMETVYTRLRNEIAHRRQNTTLELTSKEIALKVQGLQFLTKKAIELNV